jgi:hypothetical protein
MRVLIAGQTQSVCLGVVSQTDGLLAGSLLRFSGLPEFADFMLGIHVYGLVW